MAGIGRICAGLVLLTSVTLATWAQTPPPPDGPANPPPPRGDAVVRPEPPPARPMRPNLAVKVVPLKAARAGEIVRAFQAIGDFSDGLRIASDASTNSLIVVGDEPSLNTKVLPLIEALDHPGAVEDKPTDETAIVQLKNARARTVVETLTQLEPRSRGVQGLGPPIVRLVDDERTNTVWIVGEAERVHRLEAWAKTLDAPEVGPSASKRELRYYTLKNADAGALGKTVGQTMGILRMDAGIVPDHASGTLIAIATPSDQDIIASIVTRLDVPATRVRTYGEDAPEPKKSEAAPK